MRCWATVCGILRRALVDAVAEPWASRQPRPVLTDLWDDLAVAWARHAPHNLDWVSAQLYGQVAGGLWQAAILQRVQHQSVTPPAAQRPAGGLAQWRWQARWALTEAGRARACLALAAATPGDGERE